MNNVTISLQCKICRTKSEGQSQEQAIEAGWTMIEHDPEECASRYDGNCPACKHRRTRLACMNCDRDDFDFITPDQLQYAIRDGWQDVEEQQSFEEACQQYELDNIPPGRSIFDWWTHLGWCPDCVPEEDQRCSS